MAGRPKPSLAMAPVAGKKRGYVQADEKPLVLDEGAMQQFMDMLVSIGQHRSGDARARTNFKAIIREVLTRPEPATVKRGLQTWQELRLALSGSVFFYCVAERAVKPCRSSRSNTRGNDKIP